MRIPLASTTTSTITSNDFWNTISLYYTRPNLVNRKLLSVKILSTHAVVFKNKSPEYFSECFERREAIIYETKKWKRIESEGTIDDQRDLIQSILESYDNKIEVHTVEYKEGSDNDVVDMVRSSSNEYFVSLRELYARRRLNDGTKNVHELVVFDKKLSTVSFLPLYEQETPTTNLPIPNFPYHIECENHQLRLTLNCLEDADSASAEWLADKLFPKLLKWTSDTVQKPSEPQITSLTLIDAAQYSELYIDLKAKYSGELLEMWPENATTDPLKFIYEDLAIAAYLIVLWRRLETEKTFNFLDLGCGNGLLVYILNCEGFQGCGIDIRPRKLWQEFGRKKTQLKAETIIPASLKIDAGITWIIGNHSDELTPWIPVLAARHTANFFLLPCCAYEFSGVKYARKNTKLSQYTEYMGYIKEVAVQCGCFRVDMDKLRIPSTKRTCLVGVLQSESLPNRRFIEECLSVEFRPRDSVEKVRNCTQLDYALKDRIIKRIVINGILSAGDNVISKSINNGSGWNKGGSISICELCQSGVVSPEDLRDLRKEHGGLKTLLRNHRYLFRIENGEMVELREPPLLDEDNPKYKDKICWFFNWHPDGCLHTAERCAFKHELSA